MFGVRLLRRLDWTLFAAVLALCLFGLVMIYSATRAPQEIGLAPASEFARRQVVWMCLGLIAFALTIAFDYDTICRWHVPFYTLVLILLLVVLKIGKSPTGASSWIALGGFRLQPSELAKIAVILSLSGFVSRRVDSLKRLGLVLSSLLLVAVPVLLVLVQPDFGTALVIVAIWFGTLALAGGRAKHLAAVFACGLLLFTAMWNLDRLPLDRVRPTALGKVLRQAALKDYQKRRLSAFLNPRSDPLGAGYHIIQSKVGIGSGQLFGRGLFRGTQSRLRFLPERHTDFIFAVIGEELGLVGCAVVLLLFFLVFWRGMRIALRARDPLGSLLAAGAVTMLTFHAIVNIGMAVNIMPITGIPLPFVSYGGSNLLASFIAFGLMQNIHMRRDKLVF